MNEVLLTGRVVGKRATTGRLHRVMLEVYNEDARDVFRVAVYGRLRVDALPEGLSEGTRVEIAGRLANIHWRTPGAGTPVRELGIEAQTITVLSEEGVPGRVQMRASAAYIAEIRRLAEKLGLTEEELRERYLEGRDVEEVMRRDAPRILQRMAADLQAKERELQAHSQLDRLVDEDGAEIEAWAGRLLGTPVGELEEAVEALPEDGDLRRAVLQEALKRESRPRAKATLQRLLEG